MRAFLALIPFLLASGAVAQGGADGADPTPESGAGVACVAIQNDLLRLACYDAALGFEAEDDSAPVSTRVVSRSWWKFEGGVISG